MPIAVITTFKIIKMVSFRVLIEKRQSRAQSRWILELMITLIHAFDRHLRHLEVQSSTLSTRDLAREAKGYRGQVSVPNSIVSCQGKAASNRAQEFVMS